VTLLKNESRKLTSLIEHEGQGDKLTQENNHLLESAKETKTNLLKIQGVLTSLDARILSLSTILETELKGKRASDLISELNQRVKEKAETLGVKERELKSQELKLKESQSRLYTLDELTKEIDLQFSKEIHELRLISKSSLPRITQELNTLIGKLGTLSLELNSSEALFIPLMELISSQKTFYKEKTSELKMSYASVRARLEDWEKRQDRITLLKLKAQDLIQKLDRRSRLYEVLGKDELRTFVLSLVEENLITQTNDELQKLCQGRYEIVHQSRRMKLTPEFYILDKFREGGLRKVSTLSGGETFMVSLAMALGLAEMTRGKAEIDTLFIDEGFGTLDQESLEDVLDMLKQIQTRGLMVGIISHVKALTDALPVNLQVIKKQDGTSNVAIVYN
jgi:exonuclease SbcC